MKSYSPTETALNHPVPQMIWRCRFSAGELDPVWPPPVPCSDPSCLKGWKQFAIRLTSSSIATLRDKSKQRNSAFSQILIFKPRTHSPTLVPSTWPVGYITCGQHKKGKTSKRRRPTTDTNYSQIWTTSYQRHQQTIAGLVMAVKQCLLTKSARNMLWLFRSRIWSDLTVRRLFSPLPADRSIRNRFTTNDMIVVPSVSLMKRIPFQHGPVSR